MRQDHDGEVRARFGGRAPGYASSRGHASGTDLHLLLSHLPRGASLHALDVATGTGHTALALASRVGSVVGLDLTPEMLAEASGLATARGVTNVTWRRGDAHHLPFADASFDLVTVRRAPHHFVDVPRFLREALRVLRPAGTLGIVDQTVPEGPGSADFIERLEKLRDPSHVRAWSPAGWQRLLTEAGFRMDFTAVDVERCDLDAWLEPAGHGVEGRGRILAALAAASPDALQGNGFVKDAQGRWSFDKLRVVIVARPVP